MLSYFFHHLKLSQTKEAIARNLFWAVLGKIVALLSGLLVGVFVARYLGPEQYGLMNYVISYVFLFQTFSIFGLDTIEVREEARGRVPRQTIIGTAFGLKLFFGFIAVIISITTSWIMERDSYTTLLVALYSISIVFNSLSVIRNYFTAIVQNEYIVKAEISRTLLGIILKTILLVTHAPLVWIVLAYMADYILLGSGYLMAYHTKIESPREWRFDYKYARFLIHESYPLLLTSAAVIVYQRIDQVMIGQMIDKSAVGFFSVAAKFTEVLVFIPMIFAQTITPILVKFHEHDITIYQAKAQQFMNFSFWLSMLASATVSVLAYWLIRYTFGPAYLPAVAVLQVMAFKAASVALSNTAGAMLVTEGLQRYAILRDALGCVVCIGLNYLLLPRYGILAAAWITIISNLTAGYLADALIPPYRHLFIFQTKALFCGWKSLFSATSLLHRN